MKPFDSNYKYMAYLNYPSKEQAILARETVISEIKTLKKKGDQMDLSHIIAVLAVELNSQAWPQSFALWVGTIYNATEDTLKKAFSRYGVLAPDALGAKSCQCNTTETGQRYAFVNYVAYQDAKAAQQACDMGEIVLGAANSDPVIARACPSVALVDEVLASLLRTCAVLSFAQAGVIAEQVQRATKSKTKMDWLELLRRLPHVLAVDDVAETIALAKAPVAVQSAGSDLRAPILPAKASAGPPSAPALLQARPPTPAAGGALPPRCAAAAGEAAAAGHAADDSDAGWECSICSGGPGAGKAALVPCGHTFCRGCGVGLFQMGACPKCRALAEDVLLLYDA